jgi:hypothetical protein
VPLQEFEEKQEAERQARIARFAQGAGQMGPPPSASRRDVTLLDLETPDWEPPDPRSHDPHTLEATRARLVEAYNSRR